MRKAYMIITEVGYFISTDTLKKDINKAVNYFKEKYNFSKVIDIIEEPYEFNYSYELDDKEYDNFFKKVSDINKNRVDRAVMNGQM